MSDGELKVSGGKPVNHTSTPAEFLKGACSHLVFCSAWVGGTLTPFAVLFFLFGVGGWLGLGLVALIGVIAVYPLVVPVREWPWFRRNLSAWGQYYHPHVQYHLEAPEDILSASHNGVTPGVLMCYHPHGVLSWSFVLNGGFRKEFEPGVGLAADGLYNAPFFRFVAEWTRAVLPANKDTMRRLMESKSPMGLLPGGLEEATISKRGVDRVYVKSRKGFIKYALEFGYPIVPVYCFGEVDTYWNLQGMFKFRLWLNSFKIPGVFFCGAWWFPLLPKQANINTVFGKPLRIPKIANPTREDVNQWHARYVEELKALYDRHKNKFASNPGKELEVW